MAREDVPATRCVVQGRFKKRWGSRGGGHCPTLQCTSRAVRGVFCGDCGAGVLVLFTAKPFQKGRVLAPHAAFDTAPQRPRAGAFVFPSYLCKKIGKGQDKKCPLGADRAESGGVFGSPVVQKAGCRVKLAPLPGLPGCTDVHLDLPRWTFWHNTGRRRAFARLAVGGLPLGLAPRLLPGPILLPPAFHTVSVGDPV